ncbi:hypothetical protein Patl1_16985 [Pistacia atlantica]|uniref:Uncharacterized protein n=1 Tax=Pistacia atlantica TaxID=434234 RepID=A0ACC1BA54_9ROSI|nr:hypothetical protein Patl1_16985 [Pistacia atlantica]
MDTPFYGSFWNLPSRPRQAPIVREIPVHYVGSEQRVDRSGSAVKDPEGVQRFPCEKKREEDRGDKKESVDSGVRDCRKAVIKKAISLQELVDAIVSVQDDAEPVDDEENKRVVDNRSDDVEREVVENCEVKTPARDYLEESVGTNQTESQSDSSANPQSLIEACEEDVNSSLKDENDAVEAQEAEDREVNGKENRTGDENTTNRELLERMIEDNEKMMDMMAQLFERNEKQTKLLNSLSHRVEQLEKAFVCERLRRKKKRNSGTVDSCETSPDNKKCGKR